MNKDHITGRRHDSPKRGKLLPLVLVITHGCGDNVGGEVSLLRQDVGGEASLLRQNIGGEASLLRQYVGGGASLLRQDVGGEASLLRQDVGGEASSFAKTVQSFQSPIVEVSSRQSSAKTASIKAAELRRPDMRVRVRRGHRQLCSLTTTMQRSEAGGFRLLPSGRNFSPYAKLRVAYDEARLPFGYTPDDIYTSYYDEATRQWVRLQRVAVDTASHEIVSLTDHFTDFINEVIKFSELPETQAFIPTAMSNIATANPLVDHEGHRTIKLSGSASQLDNNADRMHIHAALDDVTLYQSPYIVVTPHGYTKHYYAAGERISARIGSGGLSHDTTCIMTDQTVTDLYNDLFDRCHKASNERRNSGEPPSDITAVDGNGGNQYWDTRFDGAYKWDTRPDNVTPQQTPSSTIDIPVYTPVYTPVIDNTRVVYPFVFH